MDKTKKRVFLWGWYGFENLGDDLLLHTMLKHLQGEVTVPMQKPYILPEVNQIKRSYRNLLVGAFFHDVLIIGPGGLFPFDNICKVLIYFILTRFWILNGRKVIFFGIGISEKMSGLSAFLWRRMARTANLFITRDEKVLKSLELTESEKIHSMADCVFATETVDENEKNEKNRVAISVANLQGDNQQVFNDTVEKWSNVVKNLIMKGFSVDLIAFTKGADDQMIEAILSNLKNVRFLRGGVRSIYYRDVSKTVNCWNKYYFVICMRFHSLVLSVLNDVPAIPIAYGHKILSLAEKCGLGKYTMVWNPFQSEYYGKIINISSSKILQNVDMLIADIDLVKKEMQVNKCKLVESASLAFVQLESILYQ